ncbi:MAG: Pseudouridine-5-phosphate glycosidase [Actinomycetota bacterium]
MAFEHGFCLSEEVSEAIATGKPVVALESTIISHGLPRPENLRVARSLETRIREHGAVPATIAILDGEIRVGLDDNALEEVAQRDDILKTSVRDMAPLLARRGSGATTVASTALIAHRSGISVFATGGLGGVHRYARDSWDESADLTTLANTPITVVCSGVKSILDVPATLERLETLSVTVVAYRTPNFPGFYLADSGHPVDWQVEDPAEIADIMRARAALISTSALVVGNPIPAGEQLDPDVHDSVLRDGLAQADQRGISGKDVTPFLLDHFHRSTGGVSLGVNARLVERNAELAARVASAYAQRIIV